MKNCIVSSVSQEITRIILNLKVRYRTHNRRPPVPIFTQVRPVQAPKSIYCKIDFNIIPPRRCWHCLSQTLCVNNAERIFWKKERRFS